MYSLVPKLEEMCLHLAHSCTTGVVNVCDPEIPF